MGFYKNANTEIPQYKAGEDIEIGAPGDIIGWIDVASIELSGQLMKHHDIACILSSLRPIMTTFAPAAIKTRAMPSPKPEPPPVITAVFPSILN